MKNYKKTLGVIIVVIVIILSATNIYQYKNWQKLKNSNDINELVFEIKKSKLKRFNKTPQFDVYFKGEQKILKFTFFFNNYSSDLLEHVVENDFLKVYTIVNEYFTKKTNSLKKNTIFDKENLQFAFRIGSSNIEYTFSNFDIDNFEKYDKDFAFNFVDIMVNNFSFLQNFMGVEKLKFSCVSEFTVDDLMLFKNFEKLKSISNSSIIDEKLDFMNSNFPQIEIMS